MFQGFVQLENSIEIAILVRNSSLVPVNADALPTYRVYGPAGLMPAGTGTAAFRDSKAVSAATAAAPIVVNSTGHGLTTGTRVTVAGGVGLSGLNGTTTVTVVDADHFSLDGTTGTGTYTGGATWNVTGYYTVTVTAAAADGYAAGQSYAVLAVGTVSSAGWAVVESFAVC